MTLELPGFDIPGTLGSLDLGGDVLTSGKRLSNTSLLITIQEDLPAYQNIFISLLVSNNIKTPKTAIFLNDDAFFLSCNSSSPTLRTSITHDSVAFENTSVSYSPAVAGEVSSVTLQFMPTLLMSAGSSVYFHLPEFIRSPGRLTLESNEFDAYFYNTSWVASSTLVLHLSDIPAETSVSPVIAYDSGLRLPLDGLARNDRSLKIKTDDDTIGPVAWTVIPESPAVARFANSEVLFSVSDALHVVSGEACNIQVNFNLSVALFPYDAVTLKLPSFSGYPNTDLVLEGESAGNFTASWDPHAAEITFVNKAHRLNPLSDLRILVPSASGIKMSPFGNRLNDKSLLLSTNASSGPVDPISVEKSNAVGAVLSSSLEYHPPSLGVRTGVTLRFSLALTLKLGDVVNVPP